jgi:hypothetical protein
VLTVPPDSSVDIGGVEEAGQDAPAADSSTDGGGAVDLGLDGTVGLSILDGGDASKAEAVCREGEQSACVYAGPNPCCQCGGKWLYCSNGAWYQTHCDPVGDAGFYNCTSVDSGGANLDAALDTAEAGSVGGGGG